MDFQVRIALLVGIEDTIDKIYGVGFPTVRLHRAMIEARTVVLAAWMEIFRSLSITGPVELAARLHKALNVEVGGMQDETDHGVVVVELRIAGHYGPGLGLRSLGHLGLRLAGPHEQTRGRR